MKGGDGVKEIMAWVQCRKMKNLIVSLKWVDTSSCLSVCNFVKLR